MLRRLTCAECGEATALYRTWRFNGMDDLCYSDALAEYIHPSCVEARLNEQRIAFGIDMTPMERLLGFNQLKEQQRD